MFDWTPYLGHRVIVSSRWMKLMEVIIMETSRKGRVKFKALSGNISWNENRDWNFVEDLGESLG